VGHRPFAGDDLTGPRSLDDGGATARPRRLAAGSRCSPSPSTWGGVDVFGRDFLAATFAGDPGNGLNGLLSRRRSAAMFGSWNGALRV
jgi:hypothetical protein